MKKPRIFVTFMIALVLVLGICQMAQATEVKEGEKVEHEDTTQTQNKDDSEAVLSENGKSDSETTDDNGKDSTLDSGSTDDSKTDMEEDKTSFEYWKNNINVDEDTDATEQNQEDVVETPSKDMNTENYVQAGKKPYAGKPKKPITENPFGGAEGDEANIDPFEKYKRVFNQHRARQLEAIKSITTWGDDKSRYNLINMMLQQLFTTIEGAKKNLTEAGYQLGDPFPDDEAVRDDLSNIFENTAMFGDMVLRMPDPVHDIYDRRKDWQILTNWGYGFSLESGTFDGPNEMLLRLMAQEVGILPHDPTFVNPFKSVNKKLKFEDPKPSKKKQKKKIKRGPKMAHTEL